MQHVQSRLTHLGTGLLALALFLGIADRAAAQTTILGLTADENGNGMGFGIGVFPPFPTMVGQDPGPGGRPNALIYDMASGGQTVTPGDVFVTEPSGAVGDLIRFNSPSFIPGDAAEFVFYSLPGGTDLADLAGFPTANYTNTLTIPEINGMITYHPASGQPGFLPGPGGGADFTYILTSRDPAVIPEPSSLGILAVGLVGIAGWWRRRRAV